MIKVSTNLDVPVRINLERESLSETFHSFRSITQIIRETVKNYKQPNTHRVWPQNNMLGQAPLEYHRPRS